MKRISLLLSALLLSIGGSVAVAGSCELKTTRTACPGKEAISFKKCDGQASCSKTVSVDSAEACRTKAVAACANDRLEITKSKAINATFDGKPVSNKAGGMDHCLDYSARAEEFNKCGS